MGDGEEVWDKDVLGCVSEGGRVRGMGIGPGVGGKVGKEEEWREQVSGSGGGGGGYREYRQGKPPLEHRFLDNMKPRFPSVTQRVEMDWVG